jgi:hypothetical protein
MTGRRRERKDVRMSFMVGVILFVIVLGALDARLPWPKPCGAREVRP